MEPIAALMASSYQIREVQNGLRIRAFSERSFRERALAGLIISIAGVLAANSILSLPHYSRWIWLNVLPLVAGMLVFVVTKTKSVELLAGNAEFAVRGDFGRRPPNRFVIFTADIRRIEFRPGFDLDSDGLYAVTAKAEIRLLPFLDHEQTTEVIRAIESRFPGLAEGWHAQ
jgi:hypothetical protein